MSFFDRMKGPMLDLIRAATGSVDYLAHYSAVVNQDNQNGTLDVTPEDDRLSSMQGIPMRFGIPGATAKVTPGSRVFIGFENGNPGRPIISGFGDSGAVELHLPVSVLLALGGDPAIHPLVMGDLYLAAEGTWYGALVTALGAVATYASSIKPVADPTNAATPALLTALGTTLTAASTAFGLASTASLSTKVKVQS